MKDKGEGEAEKKGKKRQNLITLGTEFLWIEKRKFYEFKIIL